MPRIAPLLGLPGSRTAVAVALCLAATLVPPAAALAGVAPAGEIRGWVIDRTAPAHAVSRQTVLLTIVERGSSAERRTLSDADGGFVFAGLPVGGIRAFLVATEYAGVHYESERVVLTPDSPSRAMTLIVYDHTQSRSAVRETLVFAVVEVVPGAVRVSVIQRFENPTDRTVVVTAKDPFRVPLPAGAEAVTFLEGWRNPQVGDTGITDAFPVRPGGAFVSYAYGLEARHSVLAVPWTLPYGTARVEILVADVGPRVAGEGLSRAGTVSEEGHRYQRWSGGPVPPGGRVAVRLDGVPGVRNVWPGVVAAALAIVLGSGLALALTRRGPFPRWAAPRRRES
ncbi:MAG TPA: hypothetical protein VFW01_07045 [bacterium]|nr:hypothetical protein [bacterium]